MFYIKTTRGWRPLHKRHYEIANFWRETGWDVEVAKLDDSDFWVSEHNYNYWDVKNRLVYSARQRAKKSSRRRKLARRRELPRFRRTRLKLAARLHVSARFSAPDFFTGPKPFNLRPFRRLLLR
jgi:hypothetical protein